MRTVLVLGHNGFTGRAFLRYVLQSALAPSFRFVGLDLSGDATLEPVTQYIGNATDVAFLERVLLAERPSYIINCAGRLSGSYDELLSANVSVSQHLLEIIAQHHMPVEKLLLIGSAAEYGIPAQLPVTEEAPLQAVTLYGLTKVLQTTLAQWYCRTQATPLVLARTFNIIGDDVPAHLSIGSFFRQIAGAKDGDVITVGNLDARRDFVHMDDILIAYWQLLTEGKPGMVYNVCSGYSVLMRDILAMMIEVSGKKLTLHCEAQRLRAFDIPDIYGDNRRLAGLAGWKPTRSVSKTIEQMFAAHRSS